MEFEYGCQITNKYSYFNESDVEDPSELLAHAAQVQAAPKAKQPVAAKPGAKQQPQQQQQQSSGKPAQQREAGAKKEPLKQQADNAVRQSGRRQEGGKPQGQRPQGQDKENNRGERRFERRGPRPEGENQQADRPPRPQGDRPPRRGPRPQGEEGQQFERRPPRRAPREFENAGGEQQQQQQQQQQQDEEGVREQRFNRAGAARPAYRRDRNRREGETNEPRQFDRHSGSDRTGVKAVDKKEGAGRRNWGIPEDDLAAQVNVQEEGAEVVAEGAQDWAKAVDENEETKAEEGEEKEAGLDFITLDQYKKLKQEVDKKNEFNIRKPGEGEDTSKWGQTYVLKKKESDEEADEEEEDEQEQQEDTEQEKRKFITNQIQIRFNEPSREKRGPRDDRRGGPREDRPRRPRQNEQGGEPQQQQQQPPQLQQKQQQGESPSKPRQGGQQRRAPGGPRGGHQQPRANVPKIEDELDFPSLGKA